MEKPVDERQLREYQTRVAQWLGKQGILFQLRYAKTTGTHTLGKQLMNLLGKAIIILLVLGIIAYIALLQYFKTENYAAKMDSQVEDGLRLEELTAEGFRRNRNSGNYRELIMKGGERTFFSNAKLGGFTAPLDFFTGVREEWTPKVVNLSSASIELKAGGEPGEMEKALELIRESFDGDGITSINIDKLTADWGYSKLTYGHFIDTLFDAKLEDGEWVIEIAGGTFQQNWIRGFMVESGRFIVGPDGIEVDELELSRGSGTLSLKGSVIGPLAMPEFDLRGSFKGLPLEALIDLQEIDPREYMEGTITGTIEITGSTNRGILTSGQVELGEEDRISVREKFSTLRALTILDTRRSYRRIDFTSGGFKFRTGNSELVVENLTLLSPDRLKLEGAFSTRLPTQQEAADDLGITLTEGLKKGLGNSFITDATDTSAAESMEADRLTLKRATDFAVEESGEDGTDEEPGSSLNKLVSVEEEEKRGLELAAAQLREQMNIHRITGEIRMAVPAIAFESNEKLAVTYPPDSQGWRWINVPLDSTITKLGQKATDDLLRSGRDRDFVPE